MSNDCISIHLVFPLPTSDCAFQPPRQRPPAQKGCRSRVTFAQWNKLHPLLKLPLFYSIWMRNSVAKRRLFRCWEDNYSWQSLWPLQSSKTWQWEHIISALCNGIVLHPVDYELPRLCRCKLAVSCTYCLNSDLFGNQQRRDLSEIFQLNHHRLAVVACNRSG